MAAVGNERLDLGGQGGDGGGVAGSEGDDDGVGVLAQQAEEEATEGPLQGKSTAWASPTVP